MPETYSHTLIRTNPKGEPMVGRCLRCGKEGITTADFWACTVPNEPAGLDLVEELDATALRSEG